MLRIANIATSLSKPALACRAALRVTRNDWHLDGTTPSYLNSQQQSEISKSSEMGHFEIALQHPGGLG